MAPKPKELEFEKLHYILLYVEFGSIFKIFQNDHVFLLL